MKSLASKYGGWAVVTGAWLFGMLIRIAIGDKRLLDPTLDATPTRKENTSLESSVTQIEIENFALACRK